MSCYKHPAPLEPQRRYRDEEAAEPQENMVILSHVRRDDATGARLY